MCARRAIGAPPRARPGIPAIVAAVLTWGCASQRPVTELFLVVDADPALRAEGGVLHLVVTGAIVGGPTEVALDRTVAGAELRWPVTVGIVPRGNDARRGVSVEATLTTSSGTTRASARTGFLPDETRVLGLSLEACCTGVVCTDLATCASCACRSDAVDPRALPPLGGDAG